MKEKQYRSDAFAAIHETMEALYDIDAIDKTTMEEFDEMCLESVPIPTGEDILALRKKEKVSPQESIKLKFKRNNG